MYVRYILLKKILNEAFVGLFSVAPANESLSFPVISTGFSKVCVVHLCFENEHPVMRVNSA